MTFEEQVKATEVMVALGGCDRIDWTKHFSQGAVAIPLCRCSRKSFPVGGSWSTWRQCKYCKQLWNFLDDK